MLLTKKLTDGRIVFIPILVLFIGVTAIWLIRQERSKADSKTTQFQKTQPDGQVKLINSYQFDRLSGEEGSFILDVHTPEQTHIPGTDAFIDYTKIKENKNKLPKDKETPIIVYCRSGGMSASASFDLAAMGYSRVYDLEGGTNAYKKEGKKSIDIEPKEKSLGTVEYGDIPKTEFILTNYTDKPLKVTRLSTSCGCTKAYLDKYTLEPFRKETIEVTFNPAVHGDSTDLGDVTRTIYVETDNPDYSKMEATITAKVIKED